jgi:hypothetical protein
VVSVPSATGRASAFDQRLWIELSPGAVSAVLQKLCYVSSARDEGATGRSLELKVVEADRTGGLQCPALGLVETITTAYDYNRKGQDLLMLKTDA